MLAKFAGSTPFIRIAGKTFPATYCVILEDGCFRISVVFDGKQYPLHDNLPVIGSDFKYWLTSVYLDCKMVNFVHEFEKGFPI